MIDVSEEIRGGGPPPSHQRTKASNWALQTTAYTLMDQLHQHERRSLPDIDCWRLGLGLMNARFRCTEQSVTLRCAGNGQEAMTSLSGKQGLWLPAEQSDLRPASSQDYNPGSPGSTYP